MSLIVILAPCFSGGETLAQRIHDCSGHRLVDEATLIERAAAWGASHLELKNALHEPAMVPGLPGRRTRISRTLISAALAEEAESGDAVYFGNAGYLLPPASFPVLRIRLTAAMESRIVEACRRLGWTRGEAKARIHQMDRRQRKWICEVCGAGGETSSLYDLAIHLECIDLDAVAAGIARLAADWAAPKAVGSGASNRASFTGKRSWRFAMAAAALLAAVAVFWSRSEPLQTVAGIVTDTRCAAQHASLPAEAFAACVRKCVEAGDGVRYAVYDGDRLYTLSDQRAAEIFAARQVKVTGVLDRNTNVLHVRSIQPAS